MKHAFVKIVPACAVIFLLTAAAKAQQPELIAKLQRTRIYEGESVGYQVMLNHIDNPSEPDLSGFKNFEVTATGQQSLNSSSVQIINGQVTRTERRGRAYSYRLTPLRAGLLTVPAPKATIDGRTIVGNPLTLSVVAPETQDVVRMKITAEPQEVYPTQPFTVSLSVLVKPLPARLADEEPLNVSSQAPKLSIPWVNDDELPAGLKPQSDWKSWLGEYRSIGRGGFVVNDLVGRSSIMSIFEDRTELLFRPRPTRVLSNDESGKPLEYWKYRFSRTFTAKSSGTYTFGPASLKGTFADGVDDDGRLRGRDIYTMARPLAFTVKDVPAEGRPASYSGLVGTFSAKAALAPTKVRLGDPMTLTLTITGRGSLAAAVPPDIATLSGVAGRFKVYEATEKTADDSISFTYSLRPLQVGDEPFPSIPVSYFDVDAGRYETIETEPLAIEVAKAERLSTRRIVSANGTRGNSNSQIEASREGIFANMSEPDGVRDDNARPLRWLVFLSVLAAVYVVLALAARHVRRVRGDTALLRRRGALTAAKTRLREGLSLLATGDVRNASQSIKDALTGLVADAADLSQAGLTPKDVAAHLRAFRISADVIARAQKLLETCDAARYAAAGIDAATLAREARDVFESLRKELKSKGLLR